MKTITAIIGSPHTRGSNTFCMVKDFLETVHSLDESIQYEIISLGSRPVGLCKGCWGCTKVGECVMQDGLQDIQSRLLASDLVILGSPVYVEHVSAQMKAFVDRSFIWLHTFRLLGKPALTAVTTGGSGMSPTEKYLNEVLYLLGTIPIGHLRGIAYQAGNFPTREKVKAKYISLAERTVAVLNRKKPLRPSFWNRWYFWGMKSKLRYGGDMLAFENRYWQERGWVKLSYDAAVRLEMKRMESLSLS
jgi:multimeric flavodoxin WrbA